MSCFCVFNVDIRMERQMFRPGEGLETLPPAGAHNRGVRLKTMPMNHTEPSYLSDFTPSGTSIAIPLFYGFEATYMLPLRVGSSVDRGVFRNSTKGSM